jgi:hypothetical protein
LENSDFTNADPTYRYASHWAVPLGTYDDPQANSWNPIVELNVTDGDVTMLFLSANDIGFLNSVGDPWYHATTLGGNYSVAILGGTAPFFLRNDTVRTIGCTERYQFCNPSLPSNTSCTALGGKEQIIPIGRSLFKDEAHQSAFYWSVSAIEAAASINMVVSLLGIGSLRRACPAVRPPFSLMRCWKNFKQNRKYWKRYHHGHRKCLG